MQFLIQRAGLRDEFYRGQWLNSLREGYGI